MNDGWLIIIAILAVLWLSQKPVQVSNEETTEWIDWQGNKRSITTHRIVRT